MDSWPFSQAWRMLILYAMPCCFKWGGKSWGCSTQISHILVRAMRLLVCSFLSLTASPKFWEHSQCNLWGQMAIVAVELLLWAYFWWWPFSLVLIMPTYVWIPFCVYLFTLLFLSFACVAILELRAYYYYYLGLIYRRHPLTLFYSFLSMTRIMQVKCEIT